MAKKSQRRRLIDAVRFALSKLPEYPWHNSEELIGYTPAECTEYRQKIDELKALLMEIDNAQLP